ncbi:MAG: ABC transporter ATP-binding protein [bacterium]
MSKIVVLEDVTKNYGNKIAVDQITVDFEEGKITGFLGLNGAGKTTTMKIITTYFKPTSGKVFVNNINALENPYEVRKLIGYLPENFPIYENLTVLDFLRFAASAKDIDKDKVEEEVEKVVKMVGLENYKNNFLRELSKGYKQRVGIAQAIIGEPKVIILDEPTQGLDPAQIVEIRNLIKQLSKNRTIILSTHIMQEVEAICDNVVIIHQGKIKASDKIENLKEKVSEITVEYLFDQSLIKSKQQQIKEVLSRYDINDSNIKFEQEVCRIKISKDLESEIEKINADFIKNEIFFRYVNKHVLTMEDLFLKIIQDNN